MNAGLNSSNIDVIFATYWFYPAKTKALLPEDQNCIDDLMKNQEQRFDVHSKSSSSEKPRDACLLLLEYRQCLNCDLAGCETRLESAKLEARRDGVGYVFLDWSASPSHQLWSLESAAVSSPTDVRNTKSILVFLSLMTSVFVTTCTAVYPSYIPVCYLS